MTRGMSVLGANAATDPSLRRFHARTAVLDEAALSAAYRLCEGLMHSRGLTMMGLAVPSKVSLDGMIRAVYGDQVTRLLDRENRSELRGTIIQLLTEKIQVRRLRGPVLAVGIPPESLLRIVAAQGVTDIVFVPETPRELDIYLGAFPESLECYPMSSFALNALAP